VGLATKQAYRGAGIAGGHAGRPDPPLAAVCRAGYFTVTKKSASNKTETKTRCGRCVRGTSGIGRTLQRPCAWCRSLVTIAGASSPSRSGTCPLSGCPAGSTLAAPHCHRHPSPTRNPRRNRTAPKPRRNRAGPCRSASPSREPPVPSSQPRVRHRGHLLSGSVRVLIGSSWVVRAVTTANAGNEACVPGRWVRHARHGRQSSNRATHAAASPATCLAPRMAVRSMGRPPGSFGSSNLSSALTSRPGPMGLARAAWASTIQSGHARCCQPATCLAPRMAVRSMGSPQAASAAPT